MLLRRLTVMFLAVCAFMAIQTPAWAAAMNTQPVAPTAQEMVLTEQQVAAVQMMVADATAGKPLIKVESWTWLFSLVTGLGQVLMGDLMRGLMFFGGQILISILAGVVSGILTATLAPVLGAAVFVIPLVFGLLGFGVWIWNLFDAYGMNQRMLGKSADIELTPSLRAHRENGAVALNQQVLAF